MGLFDKIASGLSGQSAKNTSNYSTNTSSFNAPKKVDWQCRYCGQRVGTYGDSIPKRGICLGRNKTSAGMPKPHEWRKIR